MPRVLEFLLLKLSEFFALKKTAHFFAYCRYTVASPNFLFIPYNLQCQGFKMSTWSFTSIKFCWTYGVQYVGTPVKINPSGSRKILAGIQIFEKFLFMPKKLPKSLEYACKIFDAILKIRTSNKGFKIRSELFRTRY